MFIEVTLTDIGTKQLININHIVRVGSIKSMTFIDLSNDPNQVLYISESYDEISKLIKKHFEVNLPEM